MNILMNVISKYSNTWFSSAICSKLFDTYSNSGKPMLKMALMTEILFVLILFLI